MPGHLRGFSLTELMITAALVSLGCAMAVPAVTSYVDHARINRAVSDIGSASIRLYKWRSKNGGFPDSLAQAGIAMPTDPWGRPYVYKGSGTESGKSDREDAPQHRANSDFDLYSLGADGVTATLFNEDVSKDDVVRAKNGAYIGLAAEL